MIRGLLRDMKSIVKKLQREHWQTIALLIMAYDVVTVCASYFFALWLRFDLHFGEIPNYYLAAVEKFLLFYAPFCLLVFWLFRLYRSIWRFASFNELLRVIFATIVTVAVHVLGITLLVMRMPVSYYILGAFFQFVFVLIIRFSYRFILLLRDIRTGGNTVAGSRDSIMIIGAGNAGQMLMRDIMRSPEIRGAVTCFIDDNSNKWGRFINDIPIVGGRDSIMTAVERYKVTHIFLALPSATAEQRRDILNICKETGCELKTIPGMFQLVNGEINVNALRDVDIEDLLGREPIRLDLQPVFDYINVKTILVTGGGGSIGSEICRQIAAHECCRKLIIFDIYENNAYDIQQELIRSHPNQDLEVIIGSVRDSRRLNQVFATYHPEIVYHAAAHKHVPLMEDSPCEAVKNNIIGTYKTAYAAMVSGCERFVLISTDKAVNPTNIMGASKRACEMIVQMFDAMIKQGRAGEIPLLFAHRNDEQGDMEPLRADTSTKTQFVAVRFGNVLGSNGSVVPLFEKLIAAGQDLYVTDERVTRFFMTIPEAVSLVMQASIMGSGSEIFVLDMGSPVRIYDLAENLIKLSGAEKSRIVVGHLRPGEKLYEEVLMAEEGMTDTEIEKIHIGKPIDFDVELFMSQLGELMRVSYDNNGDGIRELLKEVVCTYHPAEEEERSGSASGLTGTGVL